MEDAPEPRSALPNAMEFAADILRMVRPDAEESVTRASLAPGEEVATRHRGLEAPDVAGELRRCGGLALIVGANGSVRALSGPALAVFELAHEESVLGLRLDELFTPLASPGTSEDWVARHLERARVDSVAFVMAAPQPPYGAPDTCLELAIRPLVDDADDVRFFVGVATTAHAESVPDDSELLARCLAGIGIAVVEEPSLVAFVKRTARVLQSETHLPAVRVRAFIGGPAPTQRTGRGTTVATFPEAEWTSGAEVTFTSAPGFDQRTCVLEVLGAVPNASQRRVLERVSARLATSIVKRWSEERLLQLATHFTSLDRISSTLAASHGEPAELAELVARHLTTTPGTACIVELVDAATATLECRVVRGSDEGFASELAEFIATASPRARTTDFPSVAPPPFTLSHSEDDVPEVLAAMRASGIDIGSCVAVRIEAVGDVAGVLALCRRTATSAAVDDERAYLRAIAVRLGLAVSNARLFRENRRHVEQLEGRVKERTVALETAIDDLQDAQNELVQAEKLSSLGALVAGVAHELNTPIGNALVVATSLEALVRDLRRGVDSGSLRRGDFTRFAEDCTSATEILVRCLASARELISSFKQVAADQSSEQRRTFDLLTTARDVVEMNLPSLRRFDYRFVVEGDESVTMDSYPGAFGRVVTNLVQNAVVHGFDGLESGRVDVVVRGEGEFLASLEVRDDGRGIAPDALAHIFDAFYTTKLGRGGSGLGLQIVFNLVTNVLGGRIDVRANPRRGVTFRVVLPRVAPTRIQPGGGSE